MLGQDDVSTETGDMPPWFKTPFKDVAYLELFQSMTTEEKMQNDHSSEAQVDSE